jgi:hypothetical protein
MTFTIDVHHHILPDFFFRETNEPTTRSAVSRRRLGMPT